MNIVVMNRKDAEKYSYLPHEEKTFIISIMTPFEAYKKIYKSPYNGVQSILNLVFDDVDSGENSMSESDAQSIRRFVELHRDGKFIIQCDAGVSRSAGVAAALMKFYNGDDSPIFDNPRFRPNMLCYRTMLNELMCWRNAENEHQNM